MGDKQPLFGRDDKAHARHTDPQTSHDAADSVTGLTARRAAVLSMVQKHGPMTDVALASYYAHDNDVPEQSPSGLRTRRKELCDRGLLEDTGTTAELPSGRRAIVWGLAHEKATTTTNS